MPTHPDIAALVTPLSASRIEGIFNSFFLYPLCGKAAERVVQRSVDGVSLLCDLAH
jgi:hypothetical protein